MLWDSNTLDQIERYIKGELEGSELESFMNTVNSNSEFKKEMSSQKEIIELIEYHNLRLNLKNKLDEFHKEINIEKLKSRIYKVDYKKPRTIQRMILNSAVAASVAVIAVISTLYFSGWYFYNNKDREADYTQTINKIDQELDNISSNQESLWEMIVGVDKKPSKYSATGFAISSNGYIVTNYHVVKDMDSIFISNKAENLQRYRTELVYNDIKHDLAILKVVDENFESFGKLPYTFRNNISDLGEYVYTLGYSKKDIVFGEGSISSQNGFVGDTTAYQVSIPISPGNSGGPLIDENGNMLGIISGKHSKNEGVTFAIKSDYLISIVDSLESDSLPMPVLPTKNHLKWSKRTDQIKKIRPYIFMVETYKK